jgi:putative FmdB family regulatory protein
MPTYEYECSNCGHKFEKFQSIKASPIKKCPACGKNTAQRLIGMGAGLIFKGSGFYITDYRSESYKEKAKAEAGAPASDSKPAENKSGAAADAKPAAKPDTAPASKPESKPAPKSPPKSPPKKQ